MSTTYTLEDSAGKILSPFVQSIIKPLLQGLNAPSLNEKEEGMSFMTALLCEEVGKSLLEEPAFQELVQEVSQELLELQERRYESFLAAD